MYCLQGQSLFQCHCISEQPLIRRKISDETNCILLWLKSLCRDEFLYPARYGGTWSSISNSLPKSRAQPLKFRVLTPAHTTLNGGTRSRAKRFETIEFHSPKVPYEFPCRPSRVISPAKLPRLNSRNCAAELHSRLIRTLRYQTLAPWS